jgi:hypothetical protein
MKEKVDELRLRIEDTILDLTNFGANVEKTPEQADLFRACLEHLGIGYSVVLEMQKHFETIERLDGLLDETER